MATIGTLAVNVVAQTTRFVAPMQRAGGGIKRLAEAALAASKPIQQLAVGIANFVEKLANQPAMQKFADRWKAIMPEIERFLNVLLLAITLMEKFGVAVKGATQTNLDGYMGTTARAVERVATSTAKALNPITWLSAGFKITTGAAVGLFGAIMRLVTWPFRMMLGGVRRLIAGFRMLHTAIMSAIGRLKALAVQIISAIGITATLFTFIQRIRDTFQEIDRIAKLARRTGVTTEFVIGLGHAAKITGTEVATAEKALEKFVRTMGELREVSVGEGLQAIMSRAVSTSIMGLRGMKRAHVDVNKIMKMNTEDAFFYFMNQVSLMDNVMTQAAAMQDVFGRAGIKMRNMAALGEERLRALFHEIETLGGAFTKEQAALIENANDAVQRYNVQRQGFMNLVSMRLAPIVTRLVRHLTTGDEAIGKWHERLRAAWKAFLKLVDVAEVLYRVLKFTWEFLQASVAIPFNAIAGVRMLASAIAVQLGGVLQWIWNKVASFFPFFKDQLRQWGGWLGGLGLSIGEALAPEHVQKEARKVTKHIDKMGKEIGEIIGPGGWLSEDLEHLANQLAVDAQAEAGKAAERAAQQAGIDQDRLNKILEYTTQLQHQIDTFGMTADQIKLIELGVTELSEEYGPLIAKQKEYNDLVASADAAKKTADQTEELRKQAEQLQEQHRTAQQIKDAEEERLNLMQLIHPELVSDALFDKEMERINKQFEENRKRELGITGDKTPRAITVKSIKRGSAEAFRLQHQITQGKSMEDVAKAHKKTSDDSLSELKKLNGKITPEEAEFLKLALGGA